MVKGFFQQHWSNRDGLAIGPAFRFDQDYFRTTNSITPTTGVQDEITVSVWVKPVSGMSTGYVFKVSETTNDDYAYLSIDSAGTVSFRFGDFFVSNDTANNYIQFNSWNHILLSHKNHGSLFEFGHNDGETFNDNTHITKNSGTHRGDRTHLYIGLANLHRFAVPRAYGLTYSDEGGWTEAHGYFRNDFSRSFSDFTRTFGFYNNNYNNWSNTDPGDPNQKSGDLFTSDGTKDTMFGGHFNSSNELVNDYEGDVYQFWLKNTYYDLLDSNNVDLFRTNATTPKTSLPSSPLVFFEGSADGIVNSGSLNVGTITNNGVSSAPKP
jgi:hypothetical protein